MGVSDTIKWVVVGYGHQGKRHAECVRNNPNTELVAVIDADRSTVDGCGCIAMENMRQLKDLNIEANVISICTPNGLHEKHTLQALEHAQYVVIEKPVGLNDVSHLLPYKDRLFCVMQNRFTPAAQWLKSLDFGRLYSVHINCFWNRDIRYYGENQWRGKKHMDGGALFTQFSHFVDMLEWVCGKIDVYGATVQNIAHSNIEIDDSGVFTFGLKDGGVGSFNYSTCATGSNMESSITIIAENGTVKVGGQYMQEIEYCEGFEKPKLETPKPNTYKNGYQGSANNICKTIDNVVAHIKDREPIATTIEEGMDTINLINKIYSYGMLWKTNKAEKAAQTAQVI